MMCTFSSAMRYSFRIAGMHMNGPHISATMAMAMVLQTRDWRSCTRRLVSKTESMSCGPRLFVMWPNALTGPAACQMPFLVPQA